MVKLVADGGVLLRLPLVARDAAAGLELCGDSITEPVSCIRLAG
jgi:hypothetical protein